MSLVLEVVLLFSGVGIPTCLLLEAEIWRVHMRVCLHWTSCSAVFRTLGSSGVTRISAVVESSLYGGYTMRKECVLRRLRLECAAEEPGVS